MAEALIAGLRRAGHAGGKIIVAEPLQSRRDDLAEKYGTDPLSASSNTFTWSVFPNPTSDFIHVQGVKDAMIRVFDLSGRVIYRSHSSSNAQNINLSASPKGIYLIQVRKGQVLETKKVFKQ